MKKMAEPNPNDLSEDSVIHFEEGVIGVPGARRFPLLEAAGERVFLSGVDIFALMTDVAEALRNNQPDDVGALLPALGDALDQIAQIRAQVGFRVRQIDQQLIRHGDEETTQIRRITEIEDVDIAEAVVALQSSDTARTALSAAAARVLGRSLFDFLG